MPLAAGSSGPSGLGTKPKNDTPGRNTWGNPSRGQQSSAPALPEFLMGPVRAATPAPTYAPLPPIPAPQPTTVQTMHTVYGANGPMMVPSTTTAVTEQAQAKYQDDLHARAVGSDVQGPHLPGKGVGTPDVERMTWEQYNALSPEARAAVDFNTMLVRATRKDLHSQSDYDPSKQQQKTYDSAVQQMFGADGGSDVYAPETLAVLKQIDFKDRSADLDEFLNLNAAITSKDIKKDFEISTPMVVPAETATQPWEAQPTDPGQVRTDLVNKLVDKTQQMQAALVKGNELLATINQTAAVARNNFLTGPAGFGGLANDPNLMAGYGEAKFDANGTALNDDAYFQTAFDALANKDIDSSMALSNITADLSSHPGALEQFMSYANTRASNAERFGVSLGTKDGVQYRTPEQFRKLLGLDE